MNTAANQSAMALSSGYSQARRRLGATAVGTMVILASAGLWFDITAWLPAAESVGASLPVLLLALTIHAVVLLPFEIAGGVVLPTQYGLAAPSYGEFATRWLRGWLTFAATVLAFSACWMVAYHALGALGAVMVGAGGVVFLLAAQGILARIASVDRVDVSHEVLQSLAEHAGQSVDRVWVAQADQSAFIGGWVGLPGKETLVVPQSWLRSLSTDTRQLALLRRRGALRTGGRTLGVWVAGAWTLLGLVTVAWTTGGDLSQASGLVDLWLGFTLWSFLGVLTLPTLSRAGVYAVDAWALTQGVDQRAFIDALRQLDGNQGDEVNRTPVTETIFHPVPSLDGRVAALGNEPTWPGAWQGNRVALFLGWLGGGLLSRAVHCNCGRPSVWVLYPGD